MKRDIVVIGGGIIGLFTAYYLVRSGYKVTIVDKGDLSDGCSYGNAGMVVPSHVVPLAAPGMISLGIRWMFDPNSPFYVKPQFNREFLKWGLKFYRSSTEEKVNRAMPALKDLSMLSKELYQELHAESATFDYQEKGLVMLYQSDKVGEEEIHIAGKAEQQGLEVEYLTSEQARKLYEDPTMNVHGGIWYKYDAHLSPNKLMSYLKEYLTNNQVEFILNTEVKSLSADGDRITSLVCDKNEISADHFVLANGAWSSKLAKSIGVNFSLLPGKGYSFSQNLTEKQIKLPSILCEGKVAVTPMDRFTRFGGTMEITNVRDKSINMNRVKGIVDTVNSFFPNAELSLPEQDEVWSGFRPCSSDGLPLIGRSNKFNNLVVATGHSMMGVSLAPATGKIVENILKSNSQPIDIKLFDPNR